MWSSSPSVFTQFCCVWNDVASEKCRRFLSYFQLCSSTCFHLHADKHKTHKHNLPARLWTVWALLRCSRVQPSLGHCERASRRIPSEPTCPASTSHTYSVETQKQSPHQSKLLNMNQVEEIILQHFDTSTVCQFFSEWRDRFRSLSSCFRPFFSWWFIEDVAQVEMHDVTFSCPPITSETSESNGLFKTLSHQRVLTLALMVAV